MGVTQIAAIMGSCVAGGAYLPIMSDESLIVNKTGTIFLAGSYLVKAAVGEIIDNETLGGATTHTEISGVVDYKSPDDKSCLKTIRDLLDKISDKQTLKLNRSNSQKPKLKMEDFYGTFPFSRSSNYDVKKYLIFLLIMEILQSIKHHMVKLLFVVMLELMVGQLVSLLINEKLLKIVNLKCNLVV